jgi:hypothetical protein
MGDQWASNFHDQCCIRDYWAMIQRSISFVVSPGLANTFPSQSNTSLVV